MTDLINLLRLGISGIFFLFAGYQWEDIAPCVTWMVPYAMAIKELGPPQLNLKIHADIPQEDVFNIQTHSVDMKCLVSEASIEYKSLALTDYFHFL